MATVQELTNNPEFLSFTDAERKYVLSRASEEFNAFNDEEQAYVLSKIPQPETLQGVDAFKEGVGPAIKGVLSGKNTEEIQSDVRAAIQIRKAPEELSSIQSQLQDIPAIETPEAPVQVEKQPLQTEQGQEVEQEEPGIFKAFGKSIATVGTSTASSVGSLGGRVTEFIERQSEKVAVASKKILGTFLKGDENAFFEERTGPTETIAPLPKSTINKAFENIQKGADIITKDLAVETDGWSDPKFWASGVGSAVGSLGLFMATGGVAKQALGAKVAGAFTVLQEALLEGEGVYEDLIAQGVDPEEASKKAQATALVNLPLIKMEWNVFIKNFGKAKSALKGIAKGAGTEALQEASQQILSNFQTGKPLNEGVAESAVFGAIAGGGTGVFSGGQTAPETPLNELSKDQLEESIAQDKQAIKEKEGQVPIGEATTAQKEKALKNITETTTVFEEADKELKGIAKKESDIEGVSDPKIALEETAPAKELSVKPEGESTDTATEKVPEVESEAKIPEQSTAPKVTEKATEVAKGEAPKRELITDEEIKDIGKREHDGDPVTDKETGNILKKAGKKVKQKGLAPKEQKNFLLDEIDKAIEDAESTMGLNNKIIVELENNELDLKIKDIHTDRIADTKKFGEITIDVPGDGSFTIPNTKEALLKFKAVAKKQFPGTPAVLNAKPRTPGKTVSSKKRKGNLEELTKAATAEVEAEQAIRENAKSKSVKELRNRIDEYEKTLEGFFSQELIQEQSIFQTELNKKLREKKKPVKVPVDELSPDQAKVKKLSTPMIKTRVFSAEKSNRTSPLNELYKQELRDRGVKLKRAGKDLLKVEDVPAVGKKEAGKLIKDENNIETKITEEKPPVNEVAPEQDVKSFLADESGAIDIPIKPGDVLAEKGRGGITFEKRKQNLKQTPSDKVLEFFQLRSGTRSPSRIEGGKEIVLAAIDAERKISRSATIAQKKIVEGIFKRTSFQQFTGGISKEAAKIHDRIGNLMENLPVKNPTVFEKRTAKELKRVTNFFANALELPKDKRISFYLPHIFEGQWKIRAIDKLGNETTIPGGFAKTQRSALEKAEAFLNENPEVNINVYQTMGSAGDALLSGTAKNAKRLIEAIEEKAPREEIIKLANIAAFAGRKSATKKVRFVHLFKREANLEGYKKDALLVMQDYVASATRKIYMDRFIAKANKELNKMDPSIEKTQLENYVDYFKGTKSFSDQLMDNVLDKLGFDLEPNIASRMSGAIRQYFFVAKLGLGNVGTAALNLTQIAINTTTKLGVKAVGDGTKRYFSDRGEKFLRRKGIIYDQTKIDTGDPQFWTASKNMISKAGEFTAKPFFWSEHYNRGATYLGAYQKKFAELGFKDMFFSTPKSSKKADVKAFRKAHRESHDFANDILLKTQFVMSKADKPSLFRDPITGGAFQFKSFFVKEMEFIADLTPKEKAAFAALTLIIGGPFAMPLVRFLADRYDDFGKVVDWLNDNYNLPALAGLDFSNDAGVGFVPSNGRDMLGPSGQIGATVFLNAMSKLTGKSFIDPELFEPVGRTLKPAMLSRAEKTLKALQNNGIIKDKFGRAIDKMTPKEAWAWLAFGSRSVQFARERQLKRRFFVKKREGSKLKRELVAKILDAEDEGANGILRARKLKREIVPKFNKKFGDFVSEIDEKTFSRAKKERSKTIKERMSKRELKFRAKQEGKIFIDQKKTSLGGVPSFTKSKF